MQPKAFLFDMNGTMIDDMHYHEKAWFDILNNQIGYPISMADTKKQMYGKNEELFERLFGTEKYTNEEVAAWSLMKEKKYQQVFLPHLQLIKGLNHFLEKAQQHKIAMAIGTAASPFNVNFVLDNLPVKKYFDAIITADDVATSKPNPEVFTKCADILQVSYNDCIVFEDSPKGVQAALNAGMKAVVILSYHQQYEFDHLDNIVLFINDYTDARLNDLLL
ncbi:MAG: HAD family phosphatase [Bacteroidetes bacterium]|nr:HAD family phosphatase [Bacteroidota bacterium]MBS1757167.1 HAD family phosphatase [Bacteroidota bacterium]